MTERELINKLETKTKDIGGIITYDDEGNPTTYQSKEDNGFVYTFEVHGSRIYYLYQLQ